MSITQYNEDRIIHTLFAVMVKNGWAYYGTFDGEEMEYGESVEHAIEVMHSVDDSTLRFKKLINGEYKRGNVYVICGNGNDGWDLISDSSTGNGFGELVDEVLDEIQNLAGYNG